jgi:hypothetical protein
VDERRQRLPVAFGDPRAPPRVVVQRLTRNATNHATAIVGRMTFNGVVAATGSRRSRSFLSRACAAACEAVWARRVL